jgi:hypothetical protein
MLASSRRLKRGQIQAGPERDHRRLDENVDEQTSREEFLGGVLVLDEGGDRAAMVFQPSMAEFHGGVGSRAETKRQPIDPAPQA